jgi:hypothetical protein
MAEEWRVSLVTDGGGGTVEGSRYRDLLRARLGDDVAVSAGPGRALDPSGGEWRDLDEPAEHEDHPEPGRLQTTAIAFVKGAGQALARGDLS